MDIKLKWMDASRQTAGGTRFGVPWPKGAHKQETPLYLYGADGKAVPVQNETQAYWPDGSVKWTLHSTVLDAPQNSYTVSDRVPETPAVPETCLKIHRQEECVTVDTGAAVWTMRINDRDMLKVTHRGGDSNGRLVALCERRIETGGYDSLSQVSPFDGVAEVVRLEREGELSAVVRLRGSHVQRGAGERGRKWLPFDLRLYFYAGQAAVRMVHTFTFDGREEEDFIRGIGLEFDLPVAGALHNRFVRIGGESGLFCESPKSLWTRNDPDGAYRRQLKGEITPEAQGILQNDMTVWNDYKITQLSSDHYDISKRTGAHCVYVRGAAGKRAMGIAYAGGTNGGMAVFKRDFWQKSPASMEILGMKEPRAAIRLWFYSPEGQPMDMRRYDDKTHVQACYEGFDEMRASGYGISNTNEAVIETFSAYPGNEELVKRAGSWQEPNLLFCGPEHILSTMALGDAWGVEDRSTPGRAKVEGYLDDLFEQHKRIREEFDQYGFWDYGDIRHTYDTFRHNWLYDMGGYAWQNTELVPNLWLWYGFLRSGRPDYFRWAEAMTRHTSECDLYHLGPYKMLGSRHNVVHWGCGCKECRIGLTQLHKVYYYLTGDERIGDIMEMEKDVDFAVAAMDPLRQYFPPDPDYPCHARFGPDMMVFAGNWLTHWERTNDTRYRDKILNLLSHFAGPDGFASSSIWGYDPHTGNMKQMTKTPPSHFNYCFGSEYVWPEVLAVLDDPALWKSFLNAGLVYSSAGDPDGLDEGWEREPDTGKGIHKGEGSPRGRLSTYANGVAAYAAGKAGDQVLAKQCWEDLLRDEEHKQHDAVAVPIIVREIDEAGVHKIIHEAGHLTGNGTGQWGAHAIVMLAHIGDYLEEE